jgi:hypothetical protein
MEQRLEAAKAAAFTPLHDGWKEFTLARSLAASAAILIDLSEHRDAALVLLRDAGKLAVFAGAARGGFVDSSGRFDSDVWEAFGKTATLQRILERFDDTELRLLRWILTELSNEQVTVLESAQRASYTELLVRFVLPLTRQLEREADRVIRVRTVRLARFSAVVVLLLVGLIVAAMSWRHQGNLALRKPVRISSNFDAQRFPPEAVVDGDRNRLGCHTNAEQRPWIEIDLRGVFSVRGIVVSNRGEGLERKALPLLIETSQDGKNFQVYGRRNSVFGIWHVMPKKRVQVRYVRLTSLKNTMLHLNEVEVWK